MVTRRRLLAGSAAALGSLGVGALGLDRGALAADRPLAAALPSGAVSGFALPGGLVCPVPFMTRAAWGADESLRYSNNGGYWPEEYYPVRTLTVHHTGFAADPDPAVTVRGIYTRQTLSGDGKAGSVGWGDIGYHLLIDDQGVVYEGRYSGTDEYPIFNPAGAMVTAAHVLHYNTGNIGVCLLGYLDDTPATAAAQDSLVTVLSYLAAEGRVNPTGAVAYVNAEPGYSNYKRNVLGVSGHRDWAATDCPGSAFYPLLGGIRSRVAATMPSPPTVAPTTPSPSASTTGGPTPTPSHTPTPKPTTAKPGTRDRGGDEYVPAARKASPSAYPTKPKPSPKPKPTRTATPTPSPTVSVSATDVPVPFLTSAPAAVPVADNTSGPGWGVGATALGIVAVGALGARRWRHRTLAAEATIMDTPPGPIDVAMAAQPPVPRPPVPRPPVPDAPVPEAKAPEAQVREAQVPEAQVPEPRAPEPRAPEE